MVPHTSKKRKLAHQTEENLNVTDSSSSTEGTSSESELDGGGPFSQPHTALLKPGFLQKTKSYQMLQTFSETYASSIFQMQIDELLSEVRPKYEKRMVELEQTLHKIKEIVEGIPSREATSVGSRSSSWSTKPLIVQDLRSRATSSSAVPNCCPVSRTSTKERRKVSTRI